MVSITLTQQVEHASVDYVWQKLAAYSDMNWHPSVKESRSMGTIADGSPRMIGAERVVVNTAGNELYETVTEWDSAAKQYKMSIDKGAPGFAKTFSIGFQAREVNNKTFVDMTVDTELKFPFFLLAPLLNIVLPHKLQSFVAGFNDLREP